MKTAALDKIGGIILKDKRLLVVQKKTKDNRSEFIFPGGKRAGSESDLETLARELRVSCGLTGITRSTE